jgi:hypothetical protein
MSDLREQFPNNIRCIERCGRVALCTKMIAKGEEDLERAKTAPGYSQSGPEFETDDGRHVSFEEFMGRPNEQQLLQDAGEKLVSAGTNLRRMLIEACAQGGPIELPSLTSVVPSDEGPLEFADGITICRSPHAKAIFFTEEDLER